MSRLTRLFALAALAGALACPAFAQDVLGKRITLDLKASPPEAAFKFLADALGLTVTVDPAVTAPVDIVVKNVTAKTVLTTMCESVGCVWSVTGSTLVVKPVIDLTFTAARPKKAAAGNGQAAGATKAAALEAIRAAMSKELPGDMRFENAPLSVVSERLSAALGIELTLTCDDKSVQTITADLSRHTLQSGLKLLGEQAGDRHPLRMMLKAKGPDGDAPSIYIIFAGKKAPAKKQ
jgi:type II secretory pathway component GspD/PulD (secretin)